VGSERGETEQTKGQERERECERNIYKWGVVGVKDQNKEI